MVKLFFLILAIMHVLSKPFETNKKRKHFEMTLNAEICQQLTGELPQLSRVKTTLIAEEKSDTDPSVTKISLLLWRVKAIRFQYHGDKNETFCSVNPVIVRLAHFSAVQMEAETHSITVLLLSASFVLQKMWNCLSHIIQLKPPNKDNLILIHEQRALYVTWQLSVHPVLRSLIQRDIYKNRK